MTDDFDKLLVILYKEKFKRKIIRLLTLFYWTLSLQKKSYLPIISQLTFNDPFDIIYYDR